jgi:hypothetical protein
VRSAVHAVYALFGSRHAGAGGGFPGAVGCNHAEAGDAAVFGDERSGGLKNLLLSYEKEAKRLLSSRSFTLVAGWAKHVQQRQKLKVFLLLFLQKKKNLPPLSETQKPCFNDR